MARQPPDRGGHQRIAVPRQREERRHEEQLQQQRVLQRLLRLRRAHAGEDALVVVDRPVDARLAVVPRLVPRPRRARRLVGIVRVLFGIVAVVMMLEVHQPRHREREDDRDRRDLADPFVDPAVFRIRPRDVGMHRLVTGDIAAGRQNAGDDAGEPERHDAQHGEREQADPQRKAAPRRHDIGPHPPAMEFLGDGAFLLQQVDPRVLVEIVPAAQRKAGDFRLDIGGERLVRIARLPDRIHHSHRPRMLATRPQVPPNSRPKATALNPNGPE